MFRTSWIAAALVAALQAGAGADEVLLINGDRISGIVEDVGDEKLKITSELAGQIIIDRRHVASVTPTTLPATLPATTMTATAPAQASTTQAVATAPLKQTDNAIAEFLAQWTGSLRFSANAARGNTESETIGIAFDAKTRRDPKSREDRAEFAAAYNLGRQRDVDGSYTTSADNWFAQGKYDHFFTPKWYGYVMMRYDHDRLAFLDYRLSPGVGTGYQWVERADFNFLTEGGISYVYEEYSNNGSDERVALRLAYKLDKKLSANVSMFHTLEWLPAIKDVSDFHINADAGVRARLTRGWFTEFKIQWKHDSSPAPNAKEDDLRFLVGVGLTF